MSDNPQLQLQGGVVPVLNASLTTIAVTPYDIAVICGHTRQTMQGIAARSQIEWLLDLRLSPQAAKALMLSLEAGLVEYERRFGQIPADPQAQMNIAPQSNSATARD